MGTDALPPTTTGACRHGVPDGRDCGCCDLSPDTYPPTEAIARLTQCLQAIMADLADLLDADQFNNIEARVLAAGVPYPPLGTDPRRAPEPPAGHPPKEYVLTNKADPYENYRFYADLYDLVVVPQSSPTKPGSYGLNCPHDKDPDDCARCSDG